MSSDRPKKLGKLAVVTITGAIYVSYFWQGLAGPFFFINRPATQFAQEAVALASPGGAPDAPTTGTTFCVVYKVTYSLNSQGKSGSLHECNYASFASAVAEVERFTAQHSKGAPTEISVNRLNGKIYRSGDGGAASDTVIYWLGLVLLLILGAAVLRSSAAPNQSFKATR